MQRKGSNAHMNASRTSLPALRQKNNPSTNAGNSALPMSPKRARLGNRIAGSMGSAPPGFISPTVSRRSVNNSVFNTAASKDLANSVVKSNEDSQADLVRQILSSSQLKKNPPERASNDSALLRKSHNMSISMAARPAMHAFR